MVQKTKKGHNFIVVTFDEMVLKLNGLGLCDSCSFLMSEKGYLVPVLNSVYCEECFKEWEGRAEYFEEDAFYEAQKTEKFVRILGQD